MFFISSNSSSDSYKITRLIGVQLYANAEQLQVFGPDALSTPHLHINPLFFFYFSSQVARIYKKLAPILQSGRKRLALRSAGLSVSHQPSMDTLSMFSTLLLSCLFSSLPPSFMDFAVKICSLIPSTPPSPPYFQHSGGKKKTRSCRTKKVEQTIKINATAIVCPSTGSAAC